MDIIAVYFDNHKQHLTKCASKVQRILLLKRQSYRFASDGYNKLKVRVESEVAVVPEHLFSGKTVVANEQTGINSKQISLHFAVFLVM
jgi:hypothetical protein